MQAVFFLSIFRFYNFVRIPGEIFQQVVWCGMWVDSEPVFRGFVVRVADTIVFFFQLNDLFGLAFEGDNREIIAVKVGEHVTADIKNQDSLTVFEFGKRELLFNVITQREAEITIILNIHLEIFPAKIMLFYDNPLSLPKTRIGWS